MPPTPFEVAALRHANGPAHAEADQAKLLGLAQQVRWATNAHYTEYDELFDADEFDEANRLRDEHHAAMATLAIQMSDLITGRA